MCQCPLQNDMVCLIIYHTDPISLPVSLHSSLTARDAVRMCCLAVLKENDDTQGLCGFKELKCKTKIHSTCQNFGHTFSEVCASVTNFRLVLYYAASFISGSK